MPPHILFRNSNTLVIHFIQISFSGLVANRGIYYNCRDAKDSVGASTLSQHFASISS